MRILISKLRGWSRSSSSLRCLGPGCRTCHGVAAVLNRMIAVTADPDPADCVQAGQAVQLLPQVLVENRLVARSPPAILLPASDVLGNALLHVLRVGQCDYVARLSESSQSFDCCAQFAPVVSCSRLASNQLALHFSVAQDRGPCPWPGIADSAPVCNWNDNLAATASLSFHPPMPVRPFEFEVTGLRLGPQRWCSIICGHLIVLSQLAKWRTGMTGVHRQ